MIFDVAVASEKGPRRENEDSCGVWRRGDTDIAAAVADGLGGHVGGQKASQLAMKMFGSAVGDLPADLGQIALQIHHAIKTEQATAKEMRDMATTFSAALITQDEITTIHCGDTRIAIAKRQRHKAVNSGSHRSAALSRSWKDHEGRILDIPTKECS